MIIADFMFDADLAQTDVAVECARSRVTIGDCQINFLIENREEPEWPEDF